MSALPHKLLGTKPANGFSLVEIMVGMAIGLLGILVMLQMLSFSENQKRTTSGSDDAQNAGAIALYGMQRDIQQSGYGISAQGLIGCSVKWTTTADAASVTVPLAPVTINSTLIPAAASDTNTDTLMVIYGNSNSPEEGDTISAQPTSPTVYTVGAATSYNLGDRVITQFGVRQSPCGIAPSSLISLDTISGVAAAPNVTLGTGVANVMTNNSTPSNPPMLYNLGQTPRIQVYAVKNGNLTVCDYTAYNCGSAAYAGNAAIWVPIAGNIVSLRAQYGRDTSTAAPMTGIVSLYDQTTPVYATGSVPSYQCTWARISAVRIALVAQGNGGGGTTVTTTAPTWDGTTTVAAAAPVPGNTALAINLTSVTNWQSYHYKVFQTAVPIRNITMQGVVAGC